MSALFIFADEIGAMLPVRVLYLHDIVLPVHTVLPGPKLESIIHHMLPRDVLCVKVCFLACFKCVLSMAGEKQRKKPFISPDK